MKTAKHTGSSPEHQRVDDKQEQAERDQRDRQREHHQHWPQQGVEQADHSGGDQRRGEVLNLHAGVEVSHQQQRTGCQQPLKNEFHVASLAPVAALNEEPMSLAVKQLSCLLPPRPHARERLAIIGNP